jgi:hypothetical protein
METKTQGPRPWTWLLPEVTLLTTLFPNVLHADMLITAIKINIITYYFYSFEKLTHIIFFYFLVFYNPTTTKRNIYMIYECELPTAQGCGLPECFIQEF